MTLKDLFNEHPNSVNETYLEHMHMSSSFGFWLAIAAFCAFVHAILPFVFEKTGSGIIMKLHNRMVSNRVVKLTTKPETKSGAQLAFDSAGL
ncbi:MAG: hypothetical protein JKY12_09755 [Sneathiella sp.]|nr:hypothetical protein [Sneathiella sp.]